MSNAQFDLDTLNRVDIGMLAPSRVGKSTLIATMCLSFDALLKDRMGDKVRFSREESDNINEYPNRFILEGEERAKEETSTNEQVKTLISEWRKVAQAASGRFAAKAKGTRNATLLSFEIANANSSMPFRILDYPGGAIAHALEIDANADINGRGLAAADRVLIDYTRECFALVVPVFSLALMELYDLDAKYEQGTIDDDEYDMRSAALHKVLDMDDIVPRVAEWCISRVKSNKRGLLLIAPVKCEKYFAANDKIEKLGQLQFQTKELVFSAIVNQLLAYLDSYPGEEKNRILDAIRDFIRVEYLPVQTFGKSLFKDAKLEWYDDHDKTRNPIKQFIDRYTRRNAGAKATPVGVEGIVYEVLKYRNELMEAAYRSLAAGWQEELDSRNRGGTGFFGLLGGALKKLINELNGTNNYIRGKIRGNKEDAAKAVEFVQQIAHLNVQIGNLCRWEWDFSEDNDIILEDGEE